MQIKKIWNEVLLFMQLSEKISVDRNMMEATVNYGRFGVGNAVAKGGENEI